MARKKSTMKGYTRISRPNEILCHSLRGRVESTKRAYPSLYSSAEEKLHASGAQALFSPPLQQTLFLAFVSSYYDVVQNIHDNARVFGVESWRRYTRYIYLSRAIHDNFYFSIFNENFFFNEIYLQNLFQNGIFFDSNYSITKSRVQLRKKFLFPFMKLFHADTFDSNSLKNIFSQIHTVSYENNNSIRTFPSLGRK